MAAIDQAVRQSHHSAAASSALRTALVSFQPSMTFDDEADLDKVVKQFEYEMTSLCAPGQKVPPPDLFETVREILPSWDYQ